MEMSRRGLLGGLGCLLAGGREAMASRCLPDLPEAIRPLAGALETLQPLRVGHGFPSLPAVTIDLPAEVQSDTYGVSYLVSTAGIFPNR